MGFIGWLLVIGSHWLLLSKKAPSKTMEDGLYSGNYFDYDDDDVAKQREYEIAEDIPEGSLFVDSSFPADGRSLYFDPLNPPKGCLPSKNIRWYRINSGDLVGCETPTTYKATNLSAIIHQGSLGNSYFVNALRILACQPDYIRRMFVSDKYAAKGLYTIKVSKGGKWRYLHIDDRIPCRPSGHANFCRNEDPNEIFAILIEKAYAKLHGCYEALVYGLIEKSLPDLTLGTHIDVYRSEKMNAEEVCDIMWDVLDTAVAEKRLVGCGRFIPDPYGENASDRQGITLNHLYQAVDVVAATAEATADFDALTVGMVCVRNLQKKKGRFLGRWTYGHVLWGQYKEIGVFLQKRTQHLLFTLGLGPDPVLLEQNPDLAKSSHFASSSAGASGNKQQINTKSSTAQSAMSQAGNIIATYMSGGGKLLQQQQRGAGGGVDSDDEDDDDGLGLSMKKIYNQNKGFLPFQPESEDLFWIQIEDFVEMFNRVYTLTDYSLRERYAIKRYVSKWIPEDYVGGAVGPPVYLTKIALVEAGDDDKALEKDSDADGFSVGDDGEIFYDDQNGRDDDDFSDYDDGDGDLPAQPQRGPGEGGEGKTGDKDEGNPDWGDDPETSSAAALMDSEGRLNLMFADAPMFPISVSEPTTLCISLFQQDRRWSLQRLGDDPRSVVAANFSTRSKRLTDCMRYKVAIGFVVLKLNGAKMRVTTFKLRKIVAGSSTVEFSQSSSGIVNLGPGRYVIVPYTHTPLWQPQEYALTVQYVKYQVEFEIEDLLGERRVDEILSDDDDIADEGDEDEDGDDGKGNPKGRIIPSEDLQRAHIPTLRTVKKWEFAEDVEEMAISGLYDEVGDLARYVHSLRSEVHKLQMSVSALHAAETTKESQNQNISSFSLIAEANANITN